MSYPGGGRTEYQNIDDWLVFKWNYMVVLKVRNK